MKLLFTIISLLFTCITFSQDADFYIQTKYGYTFSLEEEGYGTSFGLSLHRHLTQGLYASISYHQGNTNNLQTFQPVTPGLEEFFHPSAMAQYNAIGIGLSKALVLSPTSSVSLSFSGIRTKNRKVIWDLEENIWGDLDFFSAQEKFSLNNVWGFVVSASYSHEIREYLSIGIYSEYQSSPNIINIGLNSQISLGVKPSEQPSNKRQPPKSALEYRFSILGGDGTDQFVQFDLEYKRQVWKIFSIYGKFSSGQKQRASDVLLNANNIPEECQSSFQDQFLTADSEREIVWYNPIHSYSYGAGINALVRSSGKSYLSLAAGLVYDYTNLVYLSSARISAGNKLSFWEENFRPYRGLYPEFSFQYDYDISEIGYIGLKTSLALIRYNFAVGIHAGVRF